MQAQILFQTNIRNSTDVAYPQGAFQNALMYLEVPKCMTAHIVQSGAQIETLPACT